jgi:hypothetical protein
VLCRGRPVSLGCWRSNLPTTGGPAESQLGSAVETPLVLGGQRGDHWDRVPLRGGTQDPSSLTAAIAPWNPILEWVPSQNGLFVEPPQRHRNTELPGVGDGLPAWSSNSMSPVTLYGPFSVI